MSKKQRKVILDLTTIEMRTNKEGDGLSSGRRTVNLEEFTSIKNIALTICALTFDRRGRASWIAPRGP